jgi:cytochrome c oxidase assembly factor 2
MSIFAGTLAVSFLVVGLPHLLPCPVPRRAFAEGEIPEELRRRRRRRKFVDGEASSEQVQAETILDKRRECPVPKPGGLVGQVLGFEKLEDGGRLPDVRIETASDRRRRSEDINENDGSS